MEHEKKEEEINCNKWRSYVLLGEIYDTLIDKAGLHGYMQQMGSNEIDEYNNRTMNIRLDGWEITLTAYKPSSDENTQVFGIEVSKQGETNPLVIVESILNLKERMNNPISCLRYLHKKDGRVVDKLFEIEDNYPTSDERIKNTITDYIVNLMLGANPEEYIGLENAEK